MKVLILSLLLWAQSTANPLATLKDEVQRVLAENQLPFTEEQERSIVLMMEERREVSEDLFGEIMDFRSGPTQGERGDRARDAIAWMRDDFLTRLRSFLTPEQNTVWSRYEDASKEVRPAAATSSTEAAAPRQQLTQYVRINNNVFTAEDITYRFGQGGGGRPATEVIERGGTGAFHGTAELLIKDEILNARNPFAQNKPPYQERQGSIDISGPILPGRLTVGFIARQNEAENVDTIHATLPSGLFELGIVRPAVTRYFSPRGTYQLSPQHSIAFNVAYEPYTRKNEGIGSFTLEERASNTKGNNWSSELRQFSALSSQSLYETRFKVTNSYSNTEPVTDTVRINVLDAFNSGGAQNASESTDRIFDFGNLFTRLGETLTIKSGFEGAYRISRTTDRSNFGGTYTFSTLQSYLEGRPLNYRVNLGEPFLEAKQFETSLFFQNDLKLTSQFTMMFGGRYDVQTNLADHNNISPRFGFAYSPGRAMVIRGGAGIFFNRLGINTVEAQQRLNGTRQYELVIDNPSFPDPFQAGTVRNTLPSVRITSPDLQAPYVNVAMVSFERTFATNLFVSATYDLQREYHRYRLRNLNAPYDATAPVLSSCRAEQSPETCVRPDPTKGNLLSLESSGNELRNVLRLNFRKRFSLLNVTMSYITQKVKADSAPGGTGDVPSDNYNLLADWGSAGGFPKHQLSSTVNAQLPLGVFLTGTMSTSSGRHYNITTGRDDNRDTQVNDRPFGVPRNSGTASEQLTFGFNISKAFFFDAATVATRKNLNLFANVTNAFNRTNFGNPSGVMTSPNFGKPISAGDPREVEVGMRYQF